MTHTLSLARARPLDDPEAHASLARFERAAGDWSPPAGCGAANHCARCANADSALCKACIMEASWRDGGLPHFQARGPHALELEAA